MSKSKKNLEGLDMTPDEVRSFTEAFKNEEFRKLFFEYAQELNDPANRKKYEEEIIALESERGVNCEFLKPEPGYVYKTTVNGTDKCFINVARCDKISPPKSTIESQGGTRGLRWQVPHSCTPPREDADKKGNRCTVYDVLFHPDTLRMAETNERFDKMVKDITCDEVEKFFKVKLDRANLKRLKKLNYFGRISEAVIRKPMSGAAEIPKLPPDDILSSMPYPYAANETPVYTDDRVTNGHQTPESNHSASAKQNGTAGSSVSTGTSKKVAVEEYATPKYTVKYRYETDWQNYATLIGGDSRLDGANRPSVIEVRIELPLLSAATQIEVDVFERHLELKSEAPAKYKLNLRFSYDVVADEASARFDKKARALTVSAPVLKTVTKPLIEELVCEVPNSDTTEAEDKSDAASVEPSVVPSQSIEDPPSQPQPQSQSQPQSQPDPCPAPHDQVIDVDEKAEPITCDSPTHSPGHCPLQSILKCHGAADGASSNSTHASPVASGKRRASKCVSFNDSIQVETPDYRMPVALAFENSPAMRERKRNRQNQTSGSDSSTEPETENDSGLQSTPPTLKAAPVTSDEVEAASELKVKTETASEPEKEKENGAKQKDNEEFAVDTMLSWNESSAANACVIDVPCEGSKKKRKRDNKRKKNASVDLAAGAKTPNLQFENGFMDELDR